MKLTLSETASIAEIVGAIAVVISLLYLSAQVRENTIEIRTANRQQLINRSFAATMDAAAHPELAGALAKLEGSELLTPTELSQYRYFVRGMLYDVQEAYLLYLEERLDEDYWGTRSAIAMVYLRQELAQESYRELKALGTLHFAFVEWMDLALERQYGD